METIQFNNQHVEQLRQWVAEAKNIVIITHTNPDGDAIGSSLGTRHVLKQVCGVATTVLIPTYSPHSFDFIADFDTLVSADKDLARCEQLLGEADLIIGIDFNVAHRVDSLCNAMVNSTARKVLVDHHKNPDIEHFPLIFSQEEASSACEVAYWLYSAAWGKECITYDAARALFTGICTDTGSFSYSCEQPSLYHAAANLVALGIDAADIHNHINNDFSIARMRFYGFAISQRLRIFPERKFAYFYLSINDMQRYGVTPADLNGLVNYTLTMRQIEIGALIREEEGRVKVSLRSKNNIDINALAREHFNGGGHLQASGATVFEPFHDVIARLENIMQVSSK